MCIVVCDVLSYRSGVGTTLNRSGLAWEELIALPRVSISKAEQEASIFSRQDACASSDASVGSDEER